MPLFTHPRPTPTRRQMQVWDQHVKSWGGDERWHDMEYHLSDPRVLWGAYWDRYNMIQIPVFPRDEFFEIAIEVAKEAKTREDFTRLMGERNKQQLAELGALLSDAALRIFYNEEDFPCKDAFDKTIQACHNPYFIYLIRLLKGSALGWEADMIWHEEPIDKPAIDPNDDYQDPNMETQHVDFWDEEYEGNMEPERHMPDEDFTLPKGTASSSPSAAQRKRKRVQFDDESIGADEQPLRESANSASNPVLLNSSSIMLAASESTISANGVNERRQKRRRLERSPAQASSPQPSTDARKSEKRSRRDEDEEVSRKRQRLESPTMQAPNSHTSSPAHSTRSKVSKKRSRHDDEYGHSPKRQKLETSATQTPVSDAPPPPQSAAEQQKRSKKRSRHDDSHSSSNKRQKRDGSVVPDTESPHTAGQLTANDTAAVGSVPQNKGHQRGSRKRKTAAANKSLARPPPSTSPSTRSSRRNGSATLWELDDSGKAKLRRPF